MGKRRVRGSKSKLTNTKAYLVSAPGLSDLKYMQACKLRLLERTKH